MAKRLFVVFFAALLVLGTSITSAQATTLTVWLLPPVTPGGTEFELNAFQQLYPDVNLNYEIIHWNAMPGRLEQARSGGAAPDVVQIGSTWVETYAANGSLAPLSTGEVEAVGGASAFYPPAWDAVTANSGAVVALPLFVDVRAILYRSDIFANLGLDAGTVFASYDNFVSALETIRAAGLTAPDGSPVYPIALHGANESDLLHNYAGFVWNAGGDLYGAGALSSGATVAGFANVADLFARGLVDPASTVQSSADAQRRFTTGGAAMTVGGSWVLRETRVSGADIVGVAPYPAGVENTVFVGGSAVGVWNSTPNRDAAVALVQFLASPEIQTRYAQSSGSLPANVRAQEADYVRGDADYAAFAQLAARGRTYPQVAQWVGVEQTLASSLAGIFQQTPAGMDSATVSATMASALSAAAAGLP